MKNVEFSRKRKRKHKEKLAKIKKNAIIPKLTKQKY